MIVISTSPQGQATKLPNPPDINYLSDTLLCMILTADQSMYQIVHSGGNVENVTNNLMNIVSNTTHENTN